MNALLAVIVICVVVGFGLASAFFVIMVPGCIVWLKAKLFKRPVLFVHFQGGKTELKTGKKDHSDDTFFQERGLVYKVDGRVYEKGLADRYGGVEMLHFTTDSAYPTSAYAAQAVRTMVDYIRTPENNFPVLRTIPDDRVVMRLLYLDDQSLQQHINHVKIDKTLLPASMQDDIKALGMDIAKGELYDEIKYAREVFSSMHTPGGSFLYQDAHSLVLNTLTTKIAMDMERNIEAKYASKKDDFVPTLKWVIMGILIIVAGAFVLIVLKSQGLV